MNGDETFADILRAMRGRGEDGRVDAPLWRKYADRLETAYRREMCEMKEIATNALDCLFKLNQLMRTPKKEGGAPCAR